jgi:hypothetical protein
MKTPLRYFRNAYNERKYYIVRGDDETYWWFDYEDGDDWEDWVTIDKKRRGVNTIDTWEAQWYYVNRTDGRPIEVTKLEVLVSCGSLPKRCKFYKVEGETNESDSVRD